MKFLIIFLTTLLFAFEAEFQNTEDIALFPDTKAILLKTTKPIKIDYSPKIYTSQGIVLLDYDKADEFVRNSLYFKGKIEDVEISVFDIDSIRNKIISKLNRHYQNCKLKQINFDENNYKQVYFTPELLKIKSKVILECR